MRTNHKAVFNESLGVRKRLHKFIQLFPESGIEAYLVVDDANVRYLTGFPASESWLLVLRNKAHYITDFRYVDEARKGLKGVPVVPYTVSRNATMFGLLKRSRVKTLGLDGRHISVSAFRRLKADAPSSLRIKLVSGLVESLRLIKETQEIRQIRACLALQYRALDYIKRVLRPGMTEREVLVKLEGYVHRAGAGFAFDPIIASGPHSCFPHARISGRKLRLHEPVLLDFGVELEGYRSDLTRMFFLGRINPLFQKIYGIVDQAQKNAIARIRDGVPVAAVDAEARNFLKQNGLDQYFSHSLGHGVGLKIHEGPRLSRKSSEILQKGMVVTVEPGVYLPGRFGIRIEDMVLVTSTGRQILSRPGAINRPCRA